ncbi:FHA domain-containing protein [Agromyces sp. NPDC055520]
MATYRHDPEAAWFAAVRGSVILVVPTAAADRLAALWPDLDGADPTPIVLDRLTAQGLAATPPFALVVRDEAAGTARVVVRGPITVRSASDEIHDAGVSTWVERVLDGAASIEVVVDGGADASALPLPVVEAVVPVRSLVSDGVEAVAAVRPAAPAPPHAPVRAERPADQIAVPAELTMVPDEETIAGPSAFANGLPAGPPQAAPTPAPVDGDHDGMTVASIDIKRLREERAARGENAAPAVGQAAPAPTDPAAPASIRMPDGTLEAIGHEVVLGRAPSVSKVSGGRIPRLITIGLGDPDISRSHVRLALEGDTVVITDLHSRNGTHVVAPGKAPVKLRSGEPTPVLTGTVVDLGGGWTIQVVDG